MNVVNKSKRLRIRLNWNSEIAIIKQVTRTARLLIEILGICCKGALHGIRNTIVGIINHQMEMVSHKAPCQDRNAKADEPLLDVRKKSITVGIVLKNDLL